MGTTQKVVPFRQKTLDSKQNLTVDSFLCEFERIITGDYEDGEDDNYDFDDYEQELISQRDYAFLCWIAGYDPGEVLLREFFKGAFSAEITRKQMAQVYILVFHAEERIEAGQVSENWFEDCTNHYISLRTRPQRNA